MGHSSTNRQRNYALMSLPVLAAILYRLCAGPQLILNDNKFLNSSAIPVLTEEELAEFQINGFVVIRGLIPSETNLAQAGQEYYNRFNPLDYLFQGSFAKLGMQIWRQEQAFASTALLGTLPAISAQLMNHPTSVRLLKDGFFGFRAQNNTGCDFHQDDRGFWPSTDSTTGVNFWIALSDYSAAQGGGIRVVNQSALDPEIAEQCLQVIRGDNPQAMYNTTCRMHELSPSCHDEMMKASVLHDLAPGDALVWDRRTFHRSEPFRVALDEPKLRYTVRYVPEEAVAEGMLHPSVENGKPFDSPYYPQVWPTLLAHEKKEIERGLGSDMPVLPILVRMIRKKVMG